MRERKSNLFMNMCLTITTIFKYATCPILLLYVIMDRSLYAIGNSVIITICVYFVITCIHIYYKPRIIDELVEDSWESWD